MSYLSESPGPILSALTFLLWIIVLAVGLVVWGCTPTVMVNPQTGDTKVVNHHMTGRLGSAIAAQITNNREIEALERAGYKKADDK